MQLLFTYQTFIMLSVNNAYIYRKTNKHKIIAVTSPQIVEVNLPSAA